MGRLKKFLQIGLLMCCAVLMIRGAMLDADAATITYSLSDIVSSNSADTWTDGKAYSTELVASNGYKLPSELHILSGNTVLGASDYTYSQATGKLSIHAESVRGDITIMGRAEKLTVIDTPTIRGSFVVHEVLTAVVSPADATVTYQWKRGNVVIDGAKSPTYTLTVADIGSEINVQITGIGDYTGQKVSTSNTKVIKQTQLPPALSDVTVSYVTKNGGNDGEIKSNSNASLEYYDKTSASWKSLPARYKSAGQYQVRFAETKDSLPSESIMVPIYEPCTSPVITDVNITHIKVPGGNTGEMTPANIMTKALEYHNGTAWVPFPAVGLTAGKYQVRFAESTEYLASAPVTLPVKEPTTLVITPADVSVTHVSVKGGASGKMKAASSKAPTMEVFVGGSWLTLPQSTMKAGIYQVRYSDTDTTFPSAACSVTIKEPADKPTGIKVTDVAVYGGNTGAITGLSTSWQISYDNKTWYDCPQTSLTGLSAGSYYFRTKENDTHLASEVETVVVKQPEITPGATIDYSNGTLKNLVPNAAYSIGDVSYTALKNGTVSILENNLAGKTVSLVKRGDGKTTLDSAPQTIVIPARPAVPAAPLIAGKSDTTIRVTALANLEYSLDGEDWKSSTTGEVLFQKLRSNYAYKVYARVKAVEGVSFSSGNAMTPVTTKKGSSSAADPKKVVVGVITDKTITVQVVDGQDYRLGTGEWVINPGGGSYTWSGLKAGTSYGVATRTSETADTMPSSATTTYITTFTKQKIDSAVFDPFKLAITGLDAGDYSINGGAPIRVEKDGMLDVENYFGRTVSLRRLGSIETKTVDSDPVKVDIISPVAAPTAGQANLGAVTSTLVSLTIPSPDPALEYQLLSTDYAPLSGWKSSTGASIVFDGLEHSTAYVIQVCLKATLTTPKSNAYISDPIYTKFYEDTPQAKVDTVAECLFGILPQAKYLVNGVSYTADADGKIAVDRGWIGQSISIVKCGDNDRTVDSMPQVLAMPGRVTTALALEVSSVTYYNGANGSIGNLNAEIEYSTDQGATWVTASTSVLDHLAPQKYQFRYKAVADQFFAGEIETVDLQIDTAVADHKQQAIAQLEQAYLEMVDSLRYTDEQLRQIRAILDAGIENINVSLHTSADVDNAVKTVLENMAQVPCSNTATADGNLIGPDITATERQYPNDSDEIWGNVYNADGLNSQLVFQIQMLGYTDTEILRNQFILATSNGTIVSADSSIDAAALSNLLHNVELKLGMDITLNNVDGTADAFSGTYQVTILLPQNLQGQGNLNVISVGSDGKVSYHPATVVGNYLTFETTHFSTYGIIGTDTLAIVKAETIQKIQDRSSALNAEDYSRDNWNTLEQLFLTAIEQVNLATTEQEVQDAWNALNQQIDQTPQKKSLGWLWILMLIVVVLIALIVVCYLVWHVRYYDGDKQVRSEFHFWRTKVLLYVYQKEGALMEGWYHDPELTDPAENGFPMPWHTVKLYAKWSVSDMSSAIEEEPVVDPDEVVETADESLPPIPEPEDDSMQPSAETDDIEALEDDTADDDAIDEDMSGEDMLLPEAIDDASEQDSDNAEEEQPASEESSALLPAPIESDMENEPEESEETSEEVSTLPPAEQDETTEDSASDASSEADQAVIPLITDQKDEPTEDSENDDSADAEALPEHVAPQLEAPAEVVEEPADDDMAQLEAPADEPVAQLEAPADESVAQLEAPADESVAQLEAPADESVAQLEAPVEHDVPALEAPTDTSEDNIRPAVIVGEVIEEDEEATAEPDRESYKNSDSYQAWLRFGESGSEDENEPDVNEIQTLEDGDEVQLFVNEKTGEKYHIRFNLSYRAKLSALSDEAKGFYRELKDEFLSYKGVKSRISWKAEGVRKGRETIAKFMVREKMLCVFLALDPEAYRDSKYVFESVQDIKAYEAVPMLVRVKSDLSCRKVKELIADMMQPREAKRLDKIPETDYSHLDDDTSTESRLKAGQLRIWAEGPDDQICANRAATATLHYLISPEATAEEAEALISDEMLASLMPPAGDILIVPDEIAEISVDQLCKKFYVGDIVDVASLKEKGLIAEDMTYVKITSAGEITKKLVVHAHMFERTAAKMILLTGGDINIITE